LVDRLRQQVGRLDVSPAELIGRNQRSALFKTMFLAFREDGAKDWYSNLVIALAHSGSQHKLQFHHIFPKAVLTGVGRSRREADDIANLAFIGGRTNKRISDRPPSIYIKQLREKVGDEVFIAQCIPLDDELLETSHYDEFLARRRELIADRLNFFLDVDNGGAASPRMDLHLRDLNERVERVELRLRRLIREQLRDDGSLLPPHVAQKSTERLLDAARRNPASVRPTDASLDKRLQYCDFRDLQDIVTSKGLWQLFEPMFGSKEVLNNRCSQLADLRNTIRHRRPLDVVTRKDGEAAVFWFGQVLAK
jgi:hypothetical protein